MNFKLLRQNRNTLENQVDEFLNCLLHDLGEFLNCLLQDFNEFRYIRLWRHTLHTELKSLVIWGVTLLRKEDDAKNVQTLSADLRAVINAVAKLTKSYEDTSTSRVNRLQKVLASIWLLKLEIFLKAQLKTFTSSGCM